MRLVVSSAAITRAASSFALIAAPAAVIASSARRKALAMAPAEIFSPNSSAIIRASRAKPTGWRWCRDSSSERIEAPNRLSGAMPSGASARKRPPQAAQRPPNRATRLTTGAIGGMSM